ncbi:hypothetical protein TEA_006215 [Camellia sinensis var. sinensis]|uniref:Uncharacterized protein n=1 Tax=Camellia sinensis var. sinensis TaxID=542762 RepID=A0A4S4DR29_CAMSN|nr:hypothetical protein TEA_006215 [Camellia sinensis var. sinensis]
MTLKRVGEKTAKLCLYINSQPVIVVASQFHGQAKGFQSMNSETQSKPLLCNTAARGDTAAKRRRRPIHSLRRPPATATQGVPVSAFHLLQINKHLILSLVASLCLSSGEKLVRIFGCPCISANSKQLRSASIWFCPLLHLFVFPPVRNWSKFLGAPAYQQTASNWSDFVSSSLWEEEGGECAVVARNKGVVVCGEREMSGEGNGVMQLVL